MGEHIEMRPMFGGKQTSKNSQRRTLNVEHKTHQLTHYFRCEFKWRMFVRYMILFGHIEHHRIVPFSTFYFSMYPLMNSKKTTPNNILLVILFIVCKWSIVWLHFAHQSFQMSSTEETSRKFLLILFREPIDFWEYSVCTNSICPFSVYLCKAFIVCSNFLPKILNKQRILLVSNALAFYMLIAKQSGLCEQRKSILLVETICLFI